MGETEGFVKIVSDARYDEILGVHIIGPHATDLIAEACVAMRLECTSEELAHTIHAHPTLSESMLEAAHATTWAAPSICKRIVKQRCIAVVPLTTAGHGRNAAVGGDRRGHRILGIVRFFKAYRIAFV